MAVAEFTVPSGHLRSLTDGKLRFEPCLSRTQVIKALPIEPMYSAVLFGKFAFRT